MIEFALDKKYEAGQFAAFVKSFLPDDYVHDERYLDIDFKTNFVTSAKRLGYCKSLGLDVLELHHKSMNDARVGISKDAFRTLLNTSFNNRALAVLIPEEGGQWRLSLLQMEAEMDDHSSRIHHSYSNPRRYSFLLGEGAHTKTPHQFLFEKGPVHAHHEGNKDLTDWDDLQNRFSVEVLTKEFYDRLYHWYQWAVERTTGIYYPNDPNTSDDDRQGISDNVIRLIVRLLFVWFIKQKGLVPKELFDEDELNKILVDFKPQATNESVYYNAILQNLFFATLNNEVGKRKFVTPDEYHGASRSFGVKTLFRDNKKGTWFKKSHDEVLELFHKVPYMNCGLFECLDKYAKSDIGQEEDILQDGFSTCDSRDKKTGHYLRRAFVPNAMFFAPEHNETVTVKDEKNKESKVSVKVQGLIHLLADYNFTIEENTPADVQVSLDPELLGRVFENLLAAYNPETGTSARKSTGSFYTPRPIVEYMVNESLVAHLKTKVEGGEALENEFRKLISYKDDEFTLTDEQRKEAINAIYDCKVLDPACGSGAFPMGMLQQMVHILGKLDPDNEQWMERVLDEALGKTKDALKNEKDKAQRLKKLNEIEAEYDEDMLNPNYKRKLYIIQHCIFGVDIQPIAMLISKLRFFISLICEQRSVDFSREDDNYGINTLPNLETKFVSANTLIPAEIKNYTGDWTVDPNLNKLKDELLAIRERHFKVKTQDSKISNREKDEAKRQEILKYIINNTSKPDDALIADRKERIKQYMTELDQYREKKMETVSVTTDLFGESHEEMVDVNATKRRELLDRIQSAEQEIRREENKKNPAGFEAAVKQVTQWNPYDQNASSPFFDPEWMFGVNNGFDIAIGNPPYISAPAQIASEALKKQREKILESGAYTTLYQKWDLYIPFIEKGINVLKENGSMTMIVPYPLTNQTYGKLLREKILAEYTLTILADLNGTKVFDNATVTNCIPFICKLKSKNDKIYISHIDSLKQFHVAFVKNLESLVPDKKTSVWNLDEEKRDVTRHLGMHVLGDFCYISKGMVLNADENSAKGEFKKEDLISLTKDNIHCRAYIEAKDISPYAIKRVRFLEYNTPRCPQKLSRPTFKELYDYPKLMFNRLGKLQAYYDEESLLTSDSMFCAVPWHLLSQVQNKSITSSIKKFSKMKRIDMEKLSLSMDLRFLLGIVNSSYASVLLANMRSGDYHIYPEHIRNIPIPNATLNQQAKIIDIVNQILSIKNNNNDADTIFLEQQIEHIVYHLYGLSYEEVQSIDPDTPITREEYENFKIEEDEQA